MTNTQTIIAVGLLIILGIMALGALILKLLSNRMDPLFARGIRRGLIIGIILTVIQVAGFALTRA